MRVAMLSYHTCPLATLGGKDTGGMNVYVRDLTRELGRKGIGVDVFTRSQDEHVPHVLHHLGHGNRVVHVPAGPETPLSRQDLANYLDEFTAGVKDFAESKEIEYDLIHCHYWLSGLAGLNLRETWNLPLIQMFHTLAIMKNRVARSGEEEPSDLRLESEAHLLQSADRVVAATPAEVAQIQWLYREDTSRVVVIPPGVDTSHFYPIPDDEAKEYIGVPCHDRMLLFVGRIEPLKGIDTLIEAVGILHKEGILDRHPFCLAVIGGDTHSSREQMTAEMERLHAMRDSLGILDLITFLGKRDQDTLPYYYSAAEVVVVPSHYESFGLVALEAMACGTPVVASETGGLAFLVRDGETGFHVPTADPEALAEKLRLIIQDDDLRAQLGRQAAEYAQAYSWSMVVEQVIDLYRSMLGKKLA
ncbi:MAG: glycosyl transferase [Anaerolineae bacterium SM23_ 63]|nr:MAG: glycosyl transferase [Anaerolineae bacterium SM23_ 63]HEY45407.1 glycosyltransferase family 1 protein [Anaerolineae bacterium]